MEKQYVYYSRNRKHAEQQSETILKKEGIYTHNIKSLHIQQENVRCLILETCKRKVLTLQEDLSFKLA